MSEDRESRTHWFTQLAERFRIHPDPVFNLMLDATIGEAPFKKIREATIRYITAPIEGQVDLRSEQELLDLAGRQLANLTPNGVVVPKQEIQTEFNQVHSSVVSWIQSLGIDDLIETVFCPLVVRLVKGQVDDQGTSRGYSSMKLHSEIWNGEPLDMITIHIPILGDLERTTVEFYHPPEDFEHEFFRVLNNYDDAKGLETRCKKYPTSLEFGHAYFADVILPHKTVKNNGEARLIIQVDLRRSTSSRDCNNAERLCNPDHVAQYIDRREWYKYGNSKFMNFKDTYTDAEKGLFSKSRYGGSLFDVVTSL